MDHGDGSQFLENCKFSKTPGKIVVAERFSYYICLFNALNIYKIGLNMRNSIFLYTVIFFVFLVAGCNKLPESQSAEESSSIQQLAEDELTVDAGDDEMGDAMNEILDEGGYKSPGTFLCNVRDSVRLSGDSIFHFVTFNGSNCAGTRLRTGLVIIRMHKDQKWGNEGAQANVTMRNFKITRLAAGAPCILNGQKTYTNLVGGRVKDVGTSIGQVIIQIRGSFTVTYEDKSTQSWNISRQRVFTGAPGGRVVTSTGLGVSGGYTYLCYWGLNRVGRQFYAKVVSAILHKEACNFFPGTGTITLHLPGANNNTLRFGFSDKNVQVIDPECPTRVKLEWEATGFSGIIYLKL